MALHEDSDWLTRALGGDWDALIDPATSGKMTVLLTLLEHWISRNENVLVFAHTLRLLDILEVRSGSRGADADSSPPSETPPPGPR